MEICVLLDSTVVHRPYLGNNTVDANIRKIMM